MLENYVSQNINTLKDIFKNHNLVAILNIYQDERNYELIEGEKILDVISEYYNYINISKFISNLNLNEIGYFKCRFLFKKIKRYI